MPAKQAPLKARPQTTRIHPTTQKSTASKVTPLKSKTQSTAIEQTPVQPPAPSPIVLKGTVEYEIDVLAVLAFLLRPFF
jgi:hypothetical protein